MSKPFLLFQAPVATRSGYGDHSRDLLESFLDLDKFDIKVIPTRWGNTPQNQLNPNTKVGKFILENVVTNIDRQPDVFVQISVANEFKKVGKYNIGITAGVETTIAPKEFIDGCNNMDLILVPSKFTKDVLQKTVYDETDKKTNQIVRQYRIEKPIEVIQEGVDLSIYEKSQKDNSFLSNVTTDFNFLVVGHWLQGDLGQDRKDIGMTIKTFCTVFKDLPKDKQPGLILKTSSAGFCVMDRESISKKIKDVTNEFGEKCPPIYLVFGDLKPEEMSKLYHHPKVKSMISFTKGEGYGRPLCEFTLTGKPIIVSKWSGQIDFLPEKNTEFLEGELKEVHGSAANQFLMRESKWFNVDYSNAAKTIYEVYNKYPSKVKKSKGLISNTKKSFSLDSMSSKLREIVDKYVKTIQRVELKLPEIKKL